MCDIGVCCNVLGMDGMGVKTRVLFERSRLFKSKFPKMKVMI